MKLIHCSDIHLDSPMEANLPPEKAEERRRELSQNFTRLAAFAREQGVRAVLIAGDLFDRERVSSRTAGELLRAVREAAEVDFLYLRGNHDESRRALGDGELPPNLRLFGEEWQYYTYDNVTVAGLELSRENCLSLYGALRLDPERCNIVMLHGQEASRPGEELISLPALREKPIHYLALGHLHSYKKAPLRWGGDYCYCGCLEGRGFDECGEKGFVLLETEGQRVKSRFVPFARRCLHTVEADITGLRTAPELAAALEKAGAEIPEKDMVKFVLRGRCTAETQKDFDYLRKKLEPRWYFVKLQDESRMELPRESYERDISLKGEFVRLVMGSSLSEGEKERVIRTGLQALSGEAVTL